MDQSAFYGVISAVNFTLLGLWWVAVKDRADVVGETPSSRLTAYLVSLQFVIPGTVSLLAQVAPEVVIVWRCAFAVAGIVGAFGIYMLARELRRTSDERVAPTLFLVFGIPLYAAVVLVALLAPALKEVLAPDFKPIQLEAFLITMLVFLGVQEAWVVSMTRAPAKDGPAEAATGRGGDYPEDGLGPLPPK
jgi:drug/metabolite transporter (DMT)-like permease